MLPCGNVCVSNQTAYLPCCNPLCSLRHAQYFDQDTVLQIPQYAADDCHEDLHCFLPSFPICRRLPPFKADRRKIDDGPSCPKYARTHPLLTPGAFTIFCAHGLCLGFSLMASQEGPRTPFEILFTRFKEGELMCRASLLAHSQLT